MNSKQKSAIEHNVRKLLASEYALHPRQGEASSSEQITAPAGLAGTAHEPTPPREGKRSRWSRLAYKSRDLLRALKAKAWVKVPVKVIFSLNAALLLLAGYLAFYPKWTVVIQEPTIEGDETSSLFQIQYDGPIPISDVETRCVWEDAQYGPPTYLRVSAIAVRNPNYPPIPWMFWGDSDTVPCSSVGRVVASRFQYAAFYLWVNYSPLGFKWLRRAKIFRFVTHPTSSGLNRIVQRVPYWGWGLPDKNVENAPTDHIATEEPKGPNPSHRR